MWKMHRKLADGIPSRARRIGHVSQARKQESHSVARCYCNVAVGADGWRRPFARKELLAVTIQARRMLGKFGDVLESSVTFTHFLPVGSGKLVACIASQLLFRDVSRMGEFGVVYAGSLRCPRRGATRLCALLRFNGCHHHRQH